MEGDKKRFSEDFEHWIQTIANGTRLMIEDPVSGVEYWVTREQILSGINQQLIDTTQDITDLETKITQETTAREQDDETLSERITINSQNIVTEGNSRLQADALLTTQIANKVTRQPLISITGTIQATAGDQMAYDPSIKKIWLSNDSLMWRGTINPSNGIIYTFNGTNYVWDGTALIEIGTGGGGTGIKTIAADYLTFFDTFLNSGFYENTGNLGGTYTGLFTSPFLKQRIDAIDKIYIRTIDVSVPGAPKPNFTIYGSTTPAPVVVEASELKLILGHLSYTIKADDPDNWKISADTDGGSIIFPSLGGITKSMTFIVPATSYPILFNEVSIAAGNTVFAIYTLNAWTIDSTIVEIPIIPNYSDISVQKKIDIDAYLSYRADGTFMCLVPSVVASAQNDKIFLSAQDNKLQIGIYQVVLKRSNYVILKLIVSGSSLNTIRVAGSGTWENKYDGFDLATIAFEKIGSVNIPDNLITYNPIHYVVGQILDGVKKVAYIFKDGDVGYDVNIQKGFMMHTPASMLTRTWQEAMNLTFADKSWRLPTQAELLLIYANKVAVGEFDAAPYWTSTQDSGSTAICINMGTGAVESHLQGSTYQSRNIFFFENYVGGVKEGEIATYSDETGESIKGSGVKLSDLVTKNSLKIGISKNGANGLVNPQLIPAEIYERKVSTINLASNCSDFSITIGGTAYGKSSLLNIIVPIDTEIIINDITPKAGLNNANAIIILS